MKRISIQLSEDTDRDLSEVAAKEGRKVSRMAVLLLEQAIKERKRKRNARIKEEGDGRTNN